VSDGLVQQYARPSRAEDDFHFSGGGCDGAELEDGLTRSVFGKVLGRFFCLEEIDLDTPAAARGAASGLVAVFRQHKDAEPRQRLRIAGKGAIGGSDQNPAQLIRIAGAHLRNARIISAGSAIGAHHQIELGREIVVEVDGRSGVEAWRLRFGESRDGLLGRAAGDQRRGASRTQQPVCGKVVGVGITGALSAYHANAATGAHALAG